MNLGQLKPCRESSWCLFWIRVGVDSVLCIPQDSDKQAGSDVIICSRKFYTMAFGRSKRSSWMNRPLSMVMPEGAKLFRKQLRKLPPSELPTISQATREEPPCCEPVDPAPGHLEPPTPALSTSSSGQTGSAPFLTLNLDKADSLNVPNCYLDDNNVSTSDSDTSVQSVRSSSSSRNSVASNAEFDRKVMVNRGVYIFDPSNSELNMSAEETYNPFDDEI